MTWVYLNLTRSYFSVPRAYCIEKNNDKKSKKEKILPTYPNFFEHVTLNAHTHTHTYIYILPYSQVSEGTYTFFARFLTRSLLYILILFCVVFPRTSLFGYFGGVFFFKREAPFKQNILVNLKYLVLSFNKQDSNSEELFTDFQELDII